MKNFSLSKQPIAVLIFALTMLLNGSSSATSADFNCTTPYNVVRTFQTSNDASFTWQGDANTAWYVRKADGYAGPIQLVVNGSVTFRGMAVGTYTIYTSTNCVGGDVCQIIFDDLIIC